MCGVGDYCWSGLGREVRGWLWLLWQILSKHIYWYPFHLVLRPGSEAVASQRRVGKAPVSMERGVPYVVR